MQKFNVQVLFEEGLHARPAAELVKNLKGIKSDVRIIKGTNTVNPKSMLGILTLGATYNDTLDLEVEGEDEEAVAENLKLFFSLK